MFFHKNVASDFRPNIFAEMRKTTNENYENTGKLFSCISYQKLFFLYKAIKQLKLSKFSANGGPCKNIVKYYLILIYFPYSRNKAEIARK